MCIRDRQGGGTVLVGGDRQGLNPDIQNARATFVGNDVVIKADALGRGDGGKVIVWADDTTRVHGAISARGGDDGKVSLRTVGVRPIGAELIISVPVPAGGALGVSAGGGLVRPVLLTVFKSSETT